MQMWKVFVVGMFLVALVALIVWQTSSNDEGDPKIDELQKIISPIFQKPKYRNVLNGVSIYKGSKSCTVDKKKIYLCLFDRDGNYYPNMMLIYVLLHEISHIICGSIGHTPEFDKIFEDLIQEAVSQGIYEVNYPIIDNYCT